MAWYDGAVVRFYDHVDDALLKFAVIIAKTGGKWVFCKQKGRETYELPGGHREAGENILEAARRELHEETGALSYRMEPVCVYSVTAPGNFNGEESFGMLYFAEITGFEHELHCEIHPKMIEEARRRGFLPELE